MGRYSAKNLIRYEDAIQLRFDTSGRIGWLTLKNYGHVFHRYAAWALHNDVQVVTIGIPAGEFSGAEAAAFYRENSESFRPLEVPRLVTDARAISISEMLDAVDVVALQTRLLMQISAHSCGGRHWGGPPASLTPSARTGFRRTALLEILRSMLQNSRGKKVAEGEGDFYFTTRKFLQDVFQSGKIHAPRITSSLRDNIAGQTGMTAYFPVPALMIQEQRSSFNGVLCNPGGVGKTSNQDMRKIEPIQVASKRMQGWKRLPVFAQFFKELDEFRKEDENRFLATTEARKELALSPRIYKNTTKYLHEHIARIDCYGFRGDTRSLLDIRDSKGFLPGITRRDQDDYRAQRETLEADLQNLTLEQYIEAVKNMDALTLGVYTADENFKAFVSTSTSTVIAKSFSNLACLGPDYFKPTNCYALRCLDGFHLPTDSDVDFNWHKRSHGNDALTHNAEQEVAVPGAIGWHNVVGMRAIRIDATGSYFSGPVFMQDALKDEYRAQVEVRTANQPGALWTPEPDENAFTALFELLSGKSQGAGYQIYWSYPHPPFDCSEQMMVSRFEHCDWVWT